MDLVHRLNEAEIADALAGRAAEQRIAECDRCSLEYAAWEDVGSKLRQDLESRAEKPVYFWTRQQARIRERLEPRRASARWASAAVFALILLAFGLIRQAVTPTPETVRTAPPVSTVRLAPMSSDDDALLEDIQTSLEREVPAPLAPAAVLVDEMASAANQGRQVKEN